MPPLRDRIRVGEEPYAVFVGGSAGASDLYAVAAAGGEILPLTYTPVAELAPALSPDGTQLAFLRALSLRDSTPGTVWLLDLRTGSERELSLPRSAAPPRRVGWSRDGRSVVIATGDDFHLFALQDRGPAHPVPPSRREQAESSLSVLVGDPVFARVVDCAGGEGLCVVAETGAPATLARNAHDPVRWGPDSVGYFIGDVLEIRPLGPGRARRLRWSNPPARPRAATFFQGAGEH